MRNTDSDRNEVLFDRVFLPCGVELPNRIVKSAMSDSLGDGCGNPTEAQISVYERWADGGVAASIIGEVQSTPDYAEKPGNLVLHSDSNQESFKTLAKKGSIGGTQLWLQLGHAGAMSYPATSKPKGPSAINIPGLRCAALSIEEIKELPREFARTARLAQELGFGGVQIHAAHGFLLSQFLSPLFNKRTDGYGGSANSRMRLLLEVVDEVRNVVDPQFVVGVKLNSTDQLDGGFEEQAALEVISALDETGIDFIDISGGTYFPGAKSSSDSTIFGPYFVQFASRGRRETSKPIMVTGGFKTKQQAIDAVTTGDIDMIGIARALVLDPDLPKNWYGPQPVDPDFPRFTSRPEGGVTAWYTMRLTEIGGGQTMGGSLDLERFLNEYTKRDEARAQKWLGHFK